MLTQAEWVVIGVTITAFALILSNRLRPDLVALLVLLTLGFTNTVPPEQALRGFSSNVVITLMGLFIITQALEDTGVIQWIALRLNKLGGGSEGRLIALFMLVGATLSLVMNNIAAGAVLLPAAVRVGTISDVRLSKLLIPLSFGTLVGGMATYLTTANIVLSSLLIEQGLDGLGMRDFIPTGGLIVVASVVYMLTVGRRLLPIRESLTQNTFIPNLQKTYQLDDRLWELKVMPNSPLVGRKVVDSGLGAEYGLSLVGIWRNQHTILMPRLVDQIMAGDILLILGREERVQALASLELKLAQGISHFDPDLNIDLAEIVIPPRSQHIGQSLKDINFRRQFGLSVVALWRGGRSYRTDVGNMPLEVGDALLVLNAPERLQRVARDRNFMTPSTPNGKPIRQQKAIWALIITTLVLAVAMFDLLPLAEVMLGGGAAMVLTGCIKMDEAYQAIEWQVIFLIAGMLPLSTALTSSGLTARIGSGLVTQLNSTPPLLIVGAMFLLTVAVTQIIGGQVAALVVGPIAISTALQSAIAPQAMAVAVAIGASTAFLTPLAHPVNLLMMGSGGYQFGDFFRVGLGMTVVTFLTLLLGMWLFWGVG